MAHVQITWQRTCEYVATVDTADLREVVAQLPDHTRDGLLPMLDSLEAGNPPWAQISTLAYCLGNSETGREYLGALADDNPELLGGTGAPEVTDLKPA